jgi:hypothetical protein
VWGTRGGVKFRRINVSNNTSSHDNVVQPANKGAIHPAVQPAEPHTKPFDLSAKKPTKKPSTKPVRPPFADDSDTSSEDLGRRLARRKAAIKPTHQPSNLLANKPTDHASDLSANKSTYISDMSMCVFDQGRGYSEEEVVQGGPKTIGQLAVLSAGSHTTVGPPAWA